MIERMEEITRSQYIGFLELYFDAKTVKNFELLLLANSVKEYQKKYPFALSPNKVFEQFQYEVNRTFACEISVERNTYEDWKNQVITTSIELYKVFAKPSKINLLSTQNELNSNVGNKEPSFYQLLYIYNNKPRELVLASAFKASGMREYCLFSGLSSTKYKSHVQQIIDYLYQSHLSLHNVERLDIKAMQYISIVEYFNRLFNKAWELSTDKPNSLEMVLSIDATYRNTYNRFNSYLNVCYQKQLETIAKQQLQATVLYTHIQTLTNVLHEV